VPKSATKTDVKKKYFELAKKYHPVRGGREGGREGGVEGGEGGREK